MSEKIVQFNEEVIKGQIKELVRDSVEEWKGNTFLDSFLEERLPEFDRAFVTQRPMNSFVVKPINIGHQLGP